MAKVLAIREHFERGSGGEVSAEYTRTGLEAHIDYGTDGVKTAWHKILFTDYAGLEAEWDAGSATTVLASALSDELSSVKYLPDLYSSTQQSYLGSTIS